MNNCESSKTDSHNNKMKMTLGIFKAKNTFLFLGALLCVSALGGSTRSTGGTFDEDDEKDQSAYKAPNLRVMSFRRGEPLVYERGGKKITVSNAWCVALANAVVTNTNSADADVIKYQQQSEHICAVVASLGTINLDALKALSKDARPMAKKPKKPVARTTEYAQVLHEKTQRQNNMYLYTNLFGFSKDVLIKTQRGHEVTIKGKWFADLFEVGVEKSAHEPNLSHEEIEKFGQGMDELQKAFEALSEIAAKKSKRVGR